MVRLCSYSWSLVRLGVLPVTHVAARNHGRFYGILMEFPNSVADLGRDLNPSLFVGVGCRFRLHLVISVAWAALDEAMCPARWTPCEIRHPSHSCHIAADDQGYFSSTAARVMQHRGGGCARFARGIHRLLERGSGS